MSLTIFVRRILGHKKRHHIVQTCTRYYSFNNNKKQIGVIGILSTALCGSLLWLQVIWFNKKISVVTDVFEVERGSSKYIYVDSPPEETDEGNKKVAPFWNSVKQKWTENRVKVLPWLNTQIENPKSLLRLAKSSDQGLRILGVYSLAENKHWQDYQYRFIAQNSDIRTLIGLARCQDVDSRFFLPVPKPPPIKHYLEDEFRILLSSLPKEDIDKCVAYFTSTALHQGNVSEERGGLHSFGGSGLEFAKSVSQVPEERVEIFCLQALDVHSTVKSHCEEIVKLGGLHLLEQLYEKRKNSIVIRRYIAKILGNLSVHENLHSHIAKSGWVTLLAQWIKSVDLTLSLHAARALANLDRDFGQRVYQDGVYLIHPIHRSKEPVYVDVIFVHGLRGGPFKTWRQQDRKEPDANVQSDGTESVRLGTYTFCWPKDWLAKDCSHIRILSVEYDSELTTWHVKCPFESEKRTLQMRANKLKDKLKQADVGSRPVIWVGHSMGGLLIKEILKQAENDVKLHDMVKNTIGVVFYSTPHRGSSLAAFTNQASFILFPTVEVQEMSRDSLFLRTLQRNFQRLALDYNFSCISFGELEKMSVGPKVKLLVVPPESSDPGIGQFYTLNTNHLNICKPWDRESDVYKLTLSFIRNCIRINKVEQWFKSGLSFPEMKK